MICERGGEGGRGNTERERERGGGERGRAERERAQSRQKHKQNGCKQVLSRERGREREGGRERENCTDFSRMNFLTPLRMVSGRQHCRGSAPLLLVASMKAPFAISIHAISTLLRCSSFSRASKGFWTPESGQFSSSQSGVQHIPTVHSRASVGTGMVNTTFSLAQFTLVQRGTYTCC